MTKTTLSITTPLFPNSGGEGCKLGIHFGNNLQNRV